MNEAKLDKLNSFLRGEISAVETYVMALDKVASGSPTRATLEENCRSHEERVRLLREEIVVLGGEPAISSGAWGAFAKLVEGGAKILGDNTAIAALEEGEDHGLKAYKIDDHELDPKVRELVVSQLLPPQQQTHQRMSTLKKQLQR